MKRILIVGLSALLLAACSNKDTSVSEKVNENEKSQSEWKDQNEASPEENEVEVTDKVFYRWKDESIGDAPQIVTYAVIKNTGKTDADVAETKITYLDSKGDVIANTQANEMYTNLSPSVLEPGDVAYLAINDDLGEEFDDLKDVEVEVSPIPVDMGVNKLESTNSKVIKTDDWGGSVNVTGFVHNKSDMDAMDIQIAAGLYDKENKFLGALLKSSDDSTTVQSGKKSSVDLGVPSFPSNMIKEIDHAEIKAISF